MKQVKAIKHSQYNRSTEGFEKRFEKNNDAVLTKLKVK